MLEFFTAVIGPSGWMVNGLIMAVMLGLLVFLFSPAMRRSEQWRATVTPLASIIGSGMLVVAPLLAFVVGPYAAPAMAILYAISFWVGSAVRYNIEAVEEIVDSTSDSRDGQERFLIWLERFSKIALTFAYVIAVAFYLELLGAFVLRGFGIESAVHQKLIATGLLLTIGTFGLVGGLRWLENWEQFAVNGKIAIIGAFLAGLAYYNLALVIDGDWRLPEMPVHVSADTARKLLGAFLVVQGFETSRYLHGAYSRALRARTMWRAQWIAAIIKVSFVGLATVLFGVFGALRETAIIDLSAEVAVTLPALLVIASVFSQFGAGVADTVGSGGLVEEATRGALRRRAVYAIVGALGIGLIWSLNVFEVIAYASRAFALFYATQCAMAAFNAWRVGEGGWQPWRALSFGLAALLMLAIAILGIPAEAQGERGG